MKKIIITFGLIAGFIIGSFMWLYAYLCEKGVISLDNSETIGYASMVIALSMVFFGIKSFRDNHSRGAIRFWKGVQVGILITLIASLMYAVSGEIYYQVNPQFVNVIMEKYAEQQVSTLKEKGASQEEIDRAANQMAEMMKMMENPVVRFGIALMEILPVGIIVTLASAAILRRREVLPA